MRWVWDNLGALVLALALALLVWVVAVNEENPYEERVFPASLPVQVVSLPEGMVLVEAVTQTADITIRAPSSVWSRLSADQVQVRADLAGLPAGTHDVPLIGSVDDRTSRVVSVLPESIRVRLEVAGSRRVDVQILGQGEVALGYEAGPPAIDPSQVTVSGPLPLVDQVAGVVANVDLTGLRAPFDEMIALTPVDTAGTPINAVVTDPSLARVSIPVHQLGGYRDVAVKVVLSGQVAFGYRITNVTVAPPVVTLFSSDPQAVGALPGYVETAPLDIQGAADDIDERVPLGLPDQISLVGDQTVLVQISIAAIETSLTLLEELEIQGLGSGLAAEPSPPTVELFLSGPLPVLDTLQPDDVRVVLDVLGLGLGTHQITPQVVILPEKVTYQSLNPATVEVVIGRATPTPAP